MKFLPVATATLAIMAITVDIGFAAPLSNDRTGGVQIYKREPSKLLEENGLLGGLTGGPSGILCSILASLSLCKNPTPPPPASSGNPAPVPVTPPSPPPPSKPQSNQPKPETNNPPAPAYSAILPPPPRPNTFDCTSDSPIQKRSTQSIIIAQTNNNNHRRGSQLLEDGGLLGGLLGSNNGVLCSVLSSLGLCKTEQQQMAKQVGDTISVNIEHKNASNGNNNDNGNNNVNGGGSSKSNND
ncbi:hypothetical protein H4219_004647 [Mycoemilia scoparia]|uniref:Uncharacterized protein n=1 Tax=Mycoemilia scoparia TaxID=417184 RepID=A0A9W8DL69_9FUNG|nr:hypothetical protein H4219_004647 [Mycoemilia scoparia]